MAWVEGLTNSQRVLHTLTNILTSANKKLVTRYRKTDSSGKPVDYELTNTNGTWKDASGNTVNISDYVAVQVPGNEVEKSKNWELVYATGRALDAKQLEINLNSMDLWEQVNGFDAKRVILKTKTTPVTVDNSYDEYNTDPDSKVSSIEMFLEIVKYKNAINPETNLEETVHPVTKASLTMRNNHYVEIRYGDKIEMPDRGKWPDETLKFNPYVKDKTTGEEQKGIGLNSNGVICVITEDTETLNLIYTPVPEADITKYEVVSEYGSTLIEKVAGGHPSEFSKFSWYVDYKEELYDAMDGGPSSDDISKGIYLMPQILAGMSETIPIQFWINCDNNRVSMVLMGDPTIDFDRYLTSFAYLGKIDSFDGEGVVNDTAGNFALTVGSATIPAKKPKPLSQPLKDKVTLDGGTAAVTSDKGADATHPAGNILEINMNGGHTAQPLPANTVDSGWYLYSQMPTTGNPTSSLEYIKKFRTGLKFVVYTADDESSASDNFDIEWANSFVDKTASGVRGVWDNNYNRYQPVPVKASMIDLSGATFSIKLKLPKSTSGAKPTKLRAFRTKCNSSQTAFAAADFNYTGAAGSAIDLLWQIGEDINLESAANVEDKGTYLAYTYIVKASDLESVPNQTAMVVPFVKTTQAEKSVTRDMVLNFVLSVSFPDTWGADTTATGVTDISMFKTRSGVYNQRHYASFITPEEYMRKDAFNPSRWTGKFHLSPTYVVHGYDGYRGWLKDTVIVDNTSIVHLDELIVNKDSKDQNKPQEIYKYFKLNASFSMLNNSPNYNYGVGILKSRSYIDETGNRIELY